MGLFKDIKDAEETRGGRWVLPGNYVLKLERCKEEISRKTKTNATVFFIAEFRIIESDNPLRAPGTTMSWIVKMTNVEFPDTSMGNVKTFMNVGLRSAGLGHGVDESEIPNLSDMSKADAAATAEGIVGESNDLVGTFFSAEAFNKKTRADTDFTVVNWDVPANLDELVQADAA
jgi:hypothetical protein